MSDRYTARTSRTVRWCESCDAPTIRPGDRYLRWVSFPSDGLFDSITSCNECSACARRYGRLALLEKSA